MLSTIMHNLSDQGDRYGTHFCSYRVSGNMLEISVQPGFRDDLDQFRQAVICIGQVLLAVENKAAGEGLKTLIQSFPNLHEKHLVAIVRIQKAEDNFTSIARNRKKYLSSHQSLLPVLNEIASLYDLDLKPMPAMPFENSELENRLSEVADKLSGQKTLVLCSKTNNPFVWLKTGYWKERVLLLKDEHPSISNLEIIILSDQWVRFCLNQYFEEPCFSQKLVFL